MFRRNYSLIAGIVASALFSSGCADDDVLLGSTDIIPNTGIASQKHFFIAPDDPAPIVFDLATNTIDFTVEVEFTAQVADRNNQLLTDSHIIYFETEWGLIEPSCTTAAGTGGCSVVWKPSGFVLPVDLNVTVVAYTIGEEEFIDPNGNGTYDDGEVFFDIEEPYINVDSTESPQFYSFGIDTVIDTINGNDLTGVNLVHDINDGFFNGGGCTHSSLCSTVLTSVTIWDAYSMDLTGGTVAVTYTVSGNITGTAIPIASSLIIQNNGGDDLTFIDVTATAFTFATALTDGAAYAVTEFFNDTGLVCTITGGTNGDGSGTINTAAVTDIDVNCL